MANVLLGFKNAIDTATLKGPSAATGFDSTQRSNIKSDIVSKVGVASGSAVDDTWFSGELANVITPRIIAIAYHSLSKSAQIRFRAGMSSLDLDFLVGQHNDSRIAWTGGDNGTYFDIDGVMRSGPAPRIDYDRTSFDNGFRFSDDLLQSSWVRIGASVLDKQTIYMAAGSICVEQSVNVKAEPYIVRGKVRVLSGDGGFAARIVDGSGTRLSSTFTATKEWKTFELTVTVVTETATGSAGLAKVAAAGLLQFKALQVYRGNIARPFFGTSGTRRFRPRGLLKEPAATNSLIHSADQTNAAYTKSGTSTVTANVLQAPDGTTSMDRFNATAANDFIQQQLTLGGTTTRGVSVFFSVLNSTATVVSLRNVWQTGGASQEVFVSFNAATGALISTGQIGGATHLGGGVEDIGGGFYRAWVTGTGTDAANTLVISRVSVASAGTNITTWGWQNEASRVTSYIPTTTVAVTRTVDSGMISGADFDFMNSSTEATLYTEHVSPAYGLLSGPTTIVSIQTADGTAFAKHMVRVPSTGVYEVDVSTSSGWDSTNTSLTPGAVKRMATRFKGNDMAFYSDGALVEAGAVFSMFSSTVTQMSIGYGGTAVAHVGSMWLQRVSYWPRGMVNSELLSVSANGPSAIDYDSGWMNVEQSDFLNELNDQQWGLKHDVVTALPEGTAVQYFTVLMIDTGNASPIQIGRLFIDTHAIQPDVDYGLQDGHVDLSTNTVSFAGTKWSKQKMRPKTVAYDMGFLSELEGRRFHELQGEVGTTEEVYYMPDPDDLAASQRYGFLGQFETLDPLKYPFFATRAAAVSLRQKL